VQATRGLRELLSKERKPPIQEVVDANVVPHLVSFMQASDRPTLQFEAAWALTNICSGWTENVKAVLDAGALPVFIK
jgi:importin subunit alpha-2